MFLFKLASRVFNVPARVRRLYVFYPTRHPLRCRGCYLPAVPVMFNCVTASHQSLASQPVNRLRKRAAHWLCNWLTLDSLTPRTRPISFRLSSSL